jgi:CubicO group peptidase (beta-lactamase class C family)
VHRSVLIVTLIAASGVVHAQGPAPSPFLLPTTPSAASKEMAVTPMPNTVPALTKADLEPFLDGLIPLQLQNQNIAGAVVSVVKDGQLLLAKGYGYADFAARKPIVVEETLFRPGSISKLFTAIAVMQLVEQGKLDLDRDVNDYLDFEIPTTYPEPVTLRRLLTHTAGFEETVKNLFLPRVQQMKPLRDYLVAALPARVFPPGKIPAYSNYGLSLAGYIVQRTSDERFEEYIDKHIFKPLKMQSSTFEQPLPEALASRMSKGYIVATKPAKSFEFVQPAPAGALSTTAADISRFMLAVLQGGTLEDGRILKPETMNEMEKRQFESHPLLDGLGFVFMDYSANGQRIVGHGGDTLYFHSDMVLILNARVGMFISYNSAGLPRPGGGRDQLERAFLDRYFPDTRSPEKDVDPAVVQKDARAVTGVYQVTLRAETTLLKIAALFGQTAVTKNRDGIITIEDAKNSRSELKRWHEVGPLVYHEVDGPDMIGFRREASGRVNERLRQPPVVEFQRVPWYENKKLILPIIGASFALSILTLLLWPVAAIVRKRYGRPLFADSVNRIFYFISRVVCLLEVSFLSVILLWLARAPRDISLLGDGLDPWLKLLRAAGWVMVVGIIFLVFAAGWFWKSRGLGWWARTHATLLALGGVIFGLFAWHWHLLDASLKF